MPSSFRCCRSRWDVAAYWRKIVNQADQNSAQRFKVDCHSKIVRSESCRVGLFHRIISNVIEMHRETQRPFYT